MLHPFQYGPALRSDQIRLLKLKRGASHTRLDFDLVVQRQGSSEYIALSYAWLSSVRDHEVTCNGQRLMITSSLRSALLRLREKYSERYLWVDAVCINQDDSLDKSVQVRRMSNIYHRASLVIVWLGEETGSTGTGVQLFSNLCDAFPSSDGEGIRSLYLDKSILPDPYEVVEIEKFGISADSRSSSWAAAGTILNASWFERRWILQEVTSASEVRFMIGSHETTSEILLGGAFRIVVFPEFRHAFNELQRAHCDRVETIVQLLRAKQEPWLHESLADVLLETAMFKSSDPRDRVFAIVGCLEGFTEEHFWSTPREQLVGDNWEIHDSEIDPQHMLDKLDALVNYDKSMVQVLTDVALCEEDQDEFMFSIFRSLCHVDVLADDVPSWVPTWEFSSSRWRPLWLESSDPHNDGMYDVEQADLTVSQDRAVLQTKGIIFDAVSVLSHPDISKDLPLATDPTEAARETLVRNLQEKCDLLAYENHIASETSDQIGSAEERLNRFLQCYTFGAGQDGVDYIAAYEAYMAYAALLWALQNDSKHTEGITASFRYRCYDLGIAPGKWEVEIAAASDMSEPCARLSEAASSWIQLETAQRTGRRFFASTGGRIGWAPHGADIGDALCVVFGFATPFAIRRVQNSFHDGPAQYRLIGASYVHDCMDGEIFQDSSLERIAISIV